jgi:cystathionine beta-lyase
LHLFGIGYSWAGPRSLAVPYDLKAMRPGGPLVGHLVRFSIGLEEATSLRTDLEQSLRAAFA